MHQLLEKEYQPRVAAPSKRRLHLVMRDFKPERDTDIVRSIKTLETINGKPVAEFWKDVEAGQAWK